ncbi:hypothetical protein C8F01DRAFT_1145587 [Mycena amicta]|nr:hypothetical protein C8F01DRAFT_1145587 [Mycena amicta]
MTRADAPGVPLDDHDLPSGDRRIVKRFNRVLAERDAARSAACLASWSNLLAVVLGDPSLLTNISPEALSPENLGADLAKLLGEVTGKQRNSSVKGDLLRLRDKFVGLISRTWRKKPAGRNQSQNRRQTDPENANPADVLNGLRDLLQKELETDKPSESLSILDRVVRLLRRQSTQRILGKLRGSFVRSLSRSSDSDDRRAPYVDADTIPSALDSPLIHIHLSDLICFAVALDVDINQDSVDPQVPKVQMTGSHCSFESSLQSGVGVVVRYTSKPGQAHRIQNCTADEAEVLIKVARGYLRVGDYSMHTTDWGYNSVDKLLEISLSNGEDDSKWQQILVGKALLPYSEGDDDARWTGHWTAPKTPRVGLLMGCCGNPAVANGFPHSLLSTWSDSERKIANRRAFEYISGAHGPGFIEMPEHVFLAMYQSRDVFMSDFKLANNWGAEHGGVRGWCMTPLTDFVRRVSDHWEVESQSAQVPILGELLGLLRDNQLDLDWARTHNAKVAIRDEAQGRVKAGTLFWLQVMMLDSWIALHVDLLVEGESHEPAVPVDAPTARACAAKLEGATHGSTGWKRARSTFLRRYLARIADGVLRQTEDGKPPSSVGVSCMSPDGDIGPSGWDGMEGDAQAWATLDAVLTLRSVLMTNRFLLMNNTDTLWKCHFHDPIMRMV